jgi:hypothetical protein
VKGPLHCSRRLARLRRGRSPVGSCLTPSPMRFASMLSVRPRLAKRFCGREEENKTRCHLHEAVAWLLRLGTRRKPGSLRLARSLVMSSGRLSHCAGAIMLAPESRSVCRRSYCRTVTCKHAIAPSPGLAIQMRPYVLMSFQQHLVFDLFNLTSSLLLSCFSRSCAFSRKYHHSLRVVDVAAVVQARRFTQHTPTHQVTKNMDPDRTIARRYRNRIILSWGSLQNTGYLRTATRKHHPTP